MLLLRNLWLQHAPIVLALHALVSSPVLANDNQLTPAEEAEGWLLLFDGESLANWKNDNGKPIAEGVIQDGAINTHGIGGYVLVYDQEFSDFEVSCDVKMSPGECNSGVFVRIEDLSDPVFTGLEVQVYSPPGLGCTILERFTIWCHPRLSPLANPESGIICWFVVKVP